MVPEESAVDTRWHSRLVARRRFGALVGGLAAELGPRVCLSRSDLPRRHPGRVEFHPPLQAGRFALPNDTYMGSVDKAIAACWHPTVGLCVPAAGPDTRKRDQPGAAVRRTRNHGDDPADFSPYVRVRRGDERTNRSSSRCRDAQARHRARNLNVVLLHDHWIADIDGVEVPFRVLGTEADAAVTHVLEPE